MKTTKKKYEKLRREYKKTKEHNTKIEKEIWILGQEKKDTWSMELRLRELSHQFQVGDVVVLKTKEIAMIRGQIKIRHYNVFVSCTALKGAVGTHRKIHERDILCHTMDLVLKNVEYKSHGYRKVNIEEGTKK